MALQCLKLLDKIFINPITKIHKATPSVPVIGALFGNSCMRYSPNLAALPKIAPEQEVVTDSSSGEKIERNEIFTNVNKQINGNSQGRLFAVIQLCGKQFKVTNEDLIIVEGYWDPQAGDKIKMEKVLLAGSSDFTLVGRPLLPSSLVHIEGTVIEKSMSQIKTNFNMRRRKQYRRTRFHRSPFTFIRINTIEIRGNVNEKMDVEGIDGRVF